MERTYPNSRILLLVCFVFALNLVFVASTFGAVAEPSRPKPGAKQKRGAIEETVLGASVLSGVKKPKHKDDELLVKFRGATDEKAKEATHRKHGATKIKELADHRLHQIKLKQGMTVAEAIQKYSQDPHVEYAEPNNIYHVSALPNDVLVNQLWGLNNTGQTGGKPGADIKAAAAWAETTGSSDVVVAILDTGIDYYHPDLLGNLWTNPNEVVGDLVDNDGNGYTDDLYGIDTYNDFPWPFDDHGHGTHVAGTIGAAGNNGIGVAGVNWQVKLLGCKFLGAGGSGDTAGAVECLDYIRGLKNSGVNIVATSNSWGGGDYSQALYDAIKSQPDILFVAAAGNDYRDTDGSIKYPSGYDLPNIISVGATDHNDNKAIFSNYGRRSVDLAAPGVKILSTLPTDNTWNITGGYGLLSGTSMATPHVTGVAALLYAQDPGRSWSATRNLLLAGADNISNQYERTVTGRRLNASGSLTCSSQPVFSILKVPTTLTIGTPVTLSALSINCGNPVGPVTVRLSGGEIITLADDGLAPDLAAGDGIFTATWTPTRTKEILLFSSVAGREVAEYPTLQVATLTLPNTPLNAAYAQVLAVSSGYPPFTWSVVDGALPAGMTLNSTTGLISGSIASPGTSYFTVQVADVYGSKAIKDLSLVGMPPGITESWRRTKDFGVSSWLPVADVATDSIGNAYVVRATGGADFDYELLKYDAAGQLLWQRQSPAGTYEEPAAVTVDGAGFIYVGGMIAPMCAPCTLDSSYQLVKYDPEGNIVWSRVRPGNRVYDITADKQNNVYITGSPDEGGYLTVKYDGDGNELWSRTYHLDTPPWVWDPRIAVDTAGNVYLAGYRETLDMPTDTALLKYDVDGNLLWAKSYYTGQDEAGSEVAVDQTGNIYLVGSFLGSTTTLFLRKIDGNGNQLWFQTYPAAFGTEGNGVTIDQNGYIYVAGSVTPNPYDGSDGLLLKYDGSGNRLWSTTFDTGGYDQGHRNAIDLDGNILLAGSVDWGGDTLTVKFTDQQALAITSATLPTASVGTNYSTSLVAKGGIPPYTWMLASGSLPTGFSLDPQTGAISGLPTAYAVATFAAKVTDSTGLIATRPFRIPVMGINPALLARGVAGTAYKQLLSGGGGTGPYTWTIESGSLPAGLSLETVTSSAATFIMGVPTAAGDFNFVVKMADTAGGFALQPFTLSIDAASCSASPARIPRTPVYYGALLQSAIDEVAQDEEVQLQLGETFGDISVDNPVLFSLKGGYDCYFADNSGLSTIHGSLTISAGTVLIENIVLTP